MDQPEPLTGPKELEVVEEPAVEDGYECSVKSYEAAAEYNEMRLLDPASDVIYPGAVEISTIYHWKTIRIYLCTYWVMEKVISRIVAIASPIGLKEFIQYWKAKV
ncbi:MAG: hypothetical protein MI921_18690 [Cytophagales bacterium]|nr:hypothetical protein [Cytophagales bacterium]